MEVESLLVRMTWQDVGEILDIPKQGARVVVTSAGNVAVFRTLDDEVLAIEDRCPHKAGPLSQGIVHGAEVTCPLHNWTINLRTGLAAAPDHGCVTTIPARQQGGRIELLLPRV